MSLQSECVCEIKNVPLRGIILSFFVVPRAPNWSCHHAKPAPCFWPRCNYVVAFLGTTACFPFLCCNFVQPIETVTHTQLGTCFSFLKLIHGEPLFLYLTYNFCHNSINFPQLLPINTSYLRSQLAHLLEKCLINVTPKGAAVNWY